MIKNDGDRQARRASSPARRSRSSATRTGSEATDYRPAYLDTITIEEGNTDEIGLARRTLSGKNLICCDSSKPPPSILARVLRNNLDQVGRARSGGAHWDPLNTKIKPFDNINIRKAVMAIADRYAIRKVAGGEAIGPIAQTYIPPGIPGHEESGGHEGFEDLDCMQYADGGSPEVARSTWTSPRRTARTSRTASTTGPTDHAGRQQHARRPRRTPRSPRQHGEARLQGQDPPVPQDTLYTKFCGVPEEQPGHVHRRRLGEGLPGPADAALADLPVEDDPPGGQRELVRARESPRSTRRSRRPRSSRPVTSATRRSPTPTRRSSEQAPALLDHLGRQHPAAVQGRPGRHEHLQRQLGLQLHEHQVTSVRAGRPARPTPRRPRTATRGRARAPRESHRRISRKSAL